MPEQTTSPQELLKRLLQSRLITAEHLVKLKQSHGGEVPDNFTAQFQDAGLVTHWQLQQIAAGRTSFFLENDRYLLLEQIGQGGMGAVYRARHTRLNRDVALKVIDPRRVTDPALIERFRREIDVCARLQHEHIVQAFDVGEHRGTTFLVLEFVEGSDLTSLVRRDGLMDPPEAAAICLQAASALAYAHAQGIIHRDIKPRNILLSTAGVTKILDMGLARITGDAVDAEQTSLTQEGAVMGTIDYMAPEQALDTHSADARCDIYSLGATLYFLLTGQPPFPGGTAAQKLVRLAHEDPQPLGQLRPDCPRELNAVVEKMMARQVGLRYQTSEEVVRSLQPLAADRIAGRPAVTASVQTAAETHRDGAHEVTTEFAPAFPFEESVLSGYHRRKRSGGRIGWLLAGSVVVLATLGTVAALIRKPPDPVAPGERENGDLAVIPEVNVEADPPTAIRVELPGHYAGISSIIWSPDGEYLATGGGDGDIRVWQADRRETTALYQDHDSCVTALEWSDDGWLASGDFYGGIQLRPAFAGRDTSATVLREPQNVLQRNTVRALTFSPDESVLVSADAERVAFWDVASRQVTESIPFIAVQLQYAPGGQLLAGADTLSAIVVWDVDDGTELWNLSAAGTPRLVRFDADDNLVVIEEGRITVWDLRAGTTLQEIDITSLRHTHLYGSLFPTSELSPAQNRCLIWTEDGPHYVDLQSGTIIPGAAIRYPPDYGFWSAAPHLNRVALGHDNLSATVDTRQHWSTASIHVVDTSKATTSQPFGTSIIVDNRPEVVVHGGRFVQALAHLYPDSLSPCWDITTGKRVERFPENAHLGPDGRLRAIVDDRIQEWPLPESSERRHTICRLEDTDDFPLPYLRWVGDGTVVWCRNSEFHVRFWNAATGDVVRTIEANLPSSPPGQYKGPWLNLNGDFMVMAYNAGPCPLQVWKQGELQPELSASTPFGHFGNRGLTMSHDSQLIVGSHSFSAHNAGIWSIPEGRELGRLPTRLDNRGFFSLEFSASDRYLLVMNQIWDVERQQLVWQCPDPVRATGLIELRASALFPDERHVAIAQDLQVQIWDWRDSEKLMTIYLLPDEQWALFNHGTECWNHSTLAPNYFRFQSTDADGAESWVTPRQYETTTGWKNDPTRVGLNLSAED